MLLDVQGDWIPVNSGQFQMQLTHPTFSASFSAQKGVCCPPGTYGAGRERGLVALTHHQKEILPYPISSGEKEDRIRNWKCGPYWWRMALQADYCWQGIGPSAVTEEHGQTNSNDQLKLSKGEGLYPPTPHPIQRPSRKLAGSHPHPLFIFSVLFVIWLPRAEQRNMHTL